jgi:hypothetical protein
MLKTVEYAVYFQAGVDRLDGDGADGAIDSRSGPAAYQDTEAARPHTYFCQLMYSMPYIITPGLGF